MKWNKFRKNKNSWILFSSCAVRGGRRRRASLSISIAPDSHICLTAFYARNIEIIMAHFCANVSGFWISLAHSCNNFDFPWLRLQSTSTYAAGKALNVFEIYSWILINLHRIMEKKQIMKHFEQKIKSVDAVEHIARHISRNVCRSGKM